MINSMINTRLFTLKNPNSVVSEAYRTLRTNIQFTNIDENMDAIVITSSGPGEGKTTTTCNLAISMAMSEKDILLIDCDMRKPRVHRNFGISNLEGLTSILMGEKNVEDVIYKGYDETKTLTILPSGPIPPNPSELVGSSRMRRFLKEMRERFDMILIDSPPLNLVTDAAILSTLVDGTIMVLQAGKTQVPAAVYCRDQLDKVNANLIGVVMNKVPIKGKGYYGHQYEEYFEEDERRSSRRSKKRRRNR